MARENRKLINPHIEWRKMAGMKDMMIHGYFSINYRILWDVVQNKVLTLKTTNPKTSKRGPQRPVISQLFVCCL
ncbi:DUF86 domain-containing protein [Bacillus benzoevorans]|uniref:Uncharacterized protein with HEPN domain n=2 Tax=Bacillus benzoevorans TaxID=1456 RepID=A0A7X0LVE6_9BACI|nr:uncharacterized protein with HEPN domain [Bacillus benzoevorans]